ncbi:MAG: 30S ribosomal protein S20 [Alphaproteobacteria bacterium]|nr:30S ribosomal protein S20 [Alphaproteobacteria bacterium]
MAHHKDAIKRNRQNEQRRMRNRHYRTMMRNRVKAVRAAVESGNVETAQTALRDAMSVIHRVAGKGIIHKNQAARRISRLNKAVKKLALGDKA